MLATKAWRSSLSSETATVLPCRSRTVLTPFSPEQLVAADVDAGQDDNAVGLVQDRDPRGSGIRSEVSLAGHQELRVAHAPLERDVLDAREAFRPQELFAHVLRSQA
jgi:hypothetical protein